MNNDLVDPSNPSAKVSPITAHTAPFPVVKVKEVKFYHNSVSTASMHRTDGKKLAFVHGVCMTDDKYDQLYLDAEIEHGNIYLRLATELEIDAYKMTINPRATIEEQVRSTLEPQLRAELTEKIRAEMLAANQLTDGGKLAGTDVNQQGAIEGSGFRASIVGSDKIADNTNAAKPTGQSTADKLAALKKQATK